MCVLSNWTNCFCVQSREILKDNLVGIYLHGSAVMGCFNQVKSDIDLIVVVNNSISDDIKRRYMDMIVDMNGSAPKKGLELSVVRKEVCNPFVYPTPFELHFSVAHLEWYKNDPLDYIARMNGLDKDLATHFTIINHRGKCLCGERIEDVFGSVDSEYYFDSIREDVRNAAEDIKDNPTYVILNLCRVLAYKEQGLILSKREGGEWGLENVSEEYHSLIRDALNDYASSWTVEYDLSLASKYAEYMLEKIKGKK